MQRRLFLKTASATTLATLATRNVWAAPTPRIAFGGIGIESSTYSRIRARVEDFTILRGNQAMIVAVRSNSLRRRKVAPVAALVWPHENRFPLFQQQIVSLEPYLQIGREAFRIGGQWSRCCRWRCVCYPG